ncbi:FadR/GntR family transcriptional regulator (plasmid) [Coraliomargarita sp. W4R53]
MTDAARLPRWGWAGRPERLGVQLVKELGADLISGTIPAGSTLPSETALCTQFGVSRTVMREALKSLELKGLISIRQGDGTTVLPRSSWNFLDREVLRVILAGGQSESVRDEARGIRSQLEAELVRMGGHLLTDADFSQLEKLLAEMDSEAETEALQRADHEFHDVILCAADSPIRRSIVRNLMDEGNSAATDALRPGAAHYIVANAEHREVFHLLQKGKVEEAAEQMRLHILRGHWLEGAAEKNQ